MKKYLIISCSLDTNSRSFILAQQAYNAMQKQKLDCQLLDLRNYSLPLSNGFEQSAYAHSQVKELHDHILAADAILLATPVYNYGVSASCKNLIELTSTNYRDILSGNAWRNKVVGLMSVSGSEIAYMAPMPFLGSLMIDFRCIVVPRFVFACVADFIKDRSNPEIEQRIEALVEEISRFATALRK